MAGNSPYLGYIMRSFNSFIVIAFVRSEKGCILLHRKKFPAQEVFLVMYFLYVFFGAGSSIPLVFFFLNDGNAIVWRQLYRGLVSHCLRLFKRCSNTSVHGARLLPRMVQLCLKSRTKVGSRRKETNVYRKNERRENFGSPFVAIIRFFFCFF